MTSGIALVCCVAAVGLSFERHDGALPRLLQATPAASTGQREKDDFRVAELKAKLLKAESGRKRKAATKAPSPRAAAAAGNTASKPLPKGALRDVWLTSAKRTALVPAFSEKAGNPARAYRPARIKTVQAATVLKDIQLSLAAQQQATNAALMLLDSQNPEDIDDGSSEGKEVVLETGFNHAKVHGERGRVGPVKGVEENDANTASSCSNYTVTSETECVPQCANVTKINQLWNTSLPECNATVANSTNTTEVAESEVAVTPAPWNKPDNTREAGLESGAAGVVAGDVWTGAQHRPIYDTIYCYDDGADGSMQRHARKANYCWFHRAYCELYCVGDIMSTPPPSVQQHTPDSVAYGYKGPHVSWASWSKRLKNLSPYAVYGAAVVGEPTFNYGGINEIHPVKVPETTGGRNGGIFEKYYQDGR